MENDRFNRQKLWFGEEGQEKLELQKVGIVGLGGIGSHVNQGLAYLGVHDFVLIDDETVEETNLNRLVGGSEEDVHSKTPKVVVAERIIKNINPDAMVDPIQANLRTKRAIDALKTCTTLFGCMDNDGARLILSELAAAYSIPLIDSSTEIFPSEESITYGGRVVIARPGDICLSCANEIDLTVAKKELADPLSKEVMKQHGYGLGEDVKAPSVISLNGVVANLAITEFLVMTSGVREPHQYLHYIANEGKLRPRTIARNPDCYTCNYLVGMRDKANLYRYIQNHHL
jgi:molybdopterin/thiamine biosynthesis adenylyltransferase